VDFPTLDSPRSGLAQKIMALFGNDFLDFELLLHAGNLPPQTFSMQAVLSLIFSSRINLAAGRKSNFMTVVAMSRFSNERTHATGSMAFSE
jgi:hypothetical protein